MNWETRFKILFTFDTIVIRDVATSNQEHQGLHISTKKKFKQNDRKRI